MDKHKYFKKQKTNVPLSDQARKKLIKIIVDWTVREMVWLKQSDYPILFKKIKSIFPKETLELYFISKGNGNKNPSGALYNCFRRRHNLFKKEIGFESHVQIQKPSKASINIDVINTLPKPVEVIRQRLINRSEPWSSVLLDWKETYPSRRNEILTKKLDEVFARWPKFKYKDGIEMVCLYINLYISKIILKLNALMYWQITKMY